MKKPIVSVVMITYAHENFIEQAINGVLMQECDFEIELIVSNDCSPDNTDEIINQILKNNPKSNLIRYIKHKKNIGSISNFIYALKEAKGSFIALCDGDDYWTDPNKLKKQVSFLLENKEFVLTGHLRNIVNNQNISINSSLIQFDEGYYSQCILFRNVLKNDFFDFNYSKLITGDTFLMLYLENFGKFKLLNFVGSSYRVSNTGVWSLKQADEKYHKSNLSYNEMLLFFNKYNYKISFSKVVTYKIDNFIRYAIRLKEEKAYFRSLYYYLKYNFNFIIKGRVNLVNIKTSIRYFK
ncbi:MAG: hypothetical protein RIQ59_559 [Bacteroidota bacterium]|jgi:glycosyltransferase involved in cell wall biosynthesis